MRVDLINMSLLVLLSIRPQPLFYAPNHYGTQVATMGIKTDCCLQVNQRPLHPFVPPLRQCTWSNWYVSICTMKVYSVYTIKRSMDWFDAINRQRYNTTKLAPRIQQRGRCGVDNNNWNRLTLLTSIKRCTARAARCWPNFNFSLFLPLIPSE